MGKKPRFKRKLRRKSSSDETDPAYLIFFGKPKPIDQSHDEPPKDLREFEDRLGGFLDNLRQLFFGFTYDVETGKTLRRDKSTEILVEALCNYEKNLENKVIHEHLETCQFLKLVLERDAPLMGQDRYLLGIERDRTGLSLPQKNVIAVQCTAQVLWHLEGNTIPTIEAMERLIKRSDPFFELLALDRFISERTLTKWISEVFPVHKEARKGRPSKKKDADSAFEELITIPGIFLEEMRKVNFLRLKFALACLTRILRSLGWELDSIWESKCITHYTASLKFYPVLYAKNWVREAYSANGSLFNP